MTYIGAQSNIQLVPYSISLQGTWKLCLEYLFCQKDYLFCDQYRISIYL